MSGATRKELEKKEGHIHMSPWCLQRILCPVLVPWSQKNHSRASRSSKKGKAAVGNDLQASGEEKDS